MFFIGEVLFSTVFHFFEAMLPFIVVGLIVSLIMRHTKGKQTEYGYVKPGEVLMDGAESKTPSPGNTTAMNILLYVGSFLIVGSILLFIKDIPSLVPFITIFVTILTYAAGIILYRCVDYLRPVATAFTYTSMILFPLWHYAFLEMGLVSEASLFISTFVSLGAYIGAAVGIESQIAGWLSYIWLILFGWTGANMIDITSSSHSLLTYAFFIWPLLVAFIPTICWARRVNWLPISFRKATKVLAQLLVPIFAVFLFLTIFTPNMGHDYPALRIIASMLAITNSLIGWLSNRKDRASLTLLRFCIQSFILLLVADVTNYSIINLKNTALDVVVAIIWLLSFVGQTICSLFIPQETEKDKAIEKGVLVASLIGIFSTWVFCASFDDIQRAAILIVAALVIALLGTLIAWRYKNIAWANATVLGIMFVPYEIFVELIPYAGNEWPIFTTYAILSLAFVGLYATIAKIQPKRSLGVALTAVVAGGVACVTTSASVNVGGAGWLVPATELALVALISKRYALFEASVYLASAAMANFAYDVYNALPTYSHDSGLAIAAIEAHIIALPLLIFGFTKERTSTTGARKILGYIALALPMFIIAGESNLTKGLILPIIFIFEFVILATIGALTRHKWMAIASAVLITITTLELTGGFNGIWLMLIGIGLIVFVAWQLTKNNKKQ